MMVDVIEKQPTRNAKGQFVLGSIGIGGRGKGSRNKLGEEFVDALHQDFLEHGADVIAEVRAQKPDQYLKVIAQVIPKEVHHKVEDYDELNDDDLEQAFIDAAARLNRSRQAGRGNQKAMRAETGEASLPN